MTLPESMHGFEFAYPWVLLGLLMLPAVAWWLGRVGPLPSVTIPTLRPLKNLGVAPRKHRGHWRLSLLLLTLGLTIFALARPRIERGDIPDPTKGIDIMLALDYSRSMAEEDFHLNGQRTNRRKALLHVVEDFIKKRPNDRIGIVCFARSPFLVSPLTMDHEWAMNSLRETDYSTGTAIGEGLAAAWQFIKKNSERNKVIILVTDGENMMGRPPLQIAPFLLRDQIRLYSIVIGAVIVTPTAAANHELHKSSRMTGGQFFQARDTETLQKIYELIDQLEKKALLQKRFVNWRELFTWPAGTALALALGQLAWTGLVRRRIP